MSITFTTDDVEYESITTVPTVSLRSSYRRVSVRDSIRGSALAAAQTLEALAEDQDSHITPTSTEPADKIDKAYDKTTEKGMTDGLFRSCMDVIRSSHHEARQIRTALILLGLFTDPELYRDWLTVFYAVIVELETKMKSDKSLNGNEILGELRGLGEKYYFAELYEKDLEHLYPSDGRSVKDHVEECLQDKPNAKAFRDQVRNMTSASQLAGAVFCLWGVFIVGGGATARQRAKKMVGEKALNVYKNVAGPGREQRKEHFIKFWDSLAPKGSVHFKEITESADLCMKSMNATIKDLSANPWWLKWLTRGVLLSTSAVFLSVVVGVYLREVPN